MTDLAWAADPVVTDDGSPWDLLVVGGGTAGLVAAQTAAGFGARVLLVERHLTGGDCLWTGCVPSKSLLAAAHAAASARAASGLGVHVGEVEVDFAAVMRHVHDAISAIAPVDSPGRLREQGVRVARGDLRLTGPHSAEVEGAPVRFDQALLATGSAPIVPDLPGLPADHTSTSDTIWRLDALPERLLVVGGGPIGCELGQAFARLGSQVTLAESDARLVPRETTDAAELVRRALVDDGVDVRLDADASDVLAEGHFDHVLVAVGRRPRTAGIGLQAAGVEVDGHGYVVVDDHLRTTHPHVWAAGDVTGHPPFTHVAGVHGSLAASNAVLGLRRSVQPERVPRVTYTQPEVAAYGVSPDDARSDPGLTVRRTEHTEVDRAIAEGRTGGHSELVLDGKGRVVGASIVGPHAGEMLAEAVLAGQAGLRARTIAGAMHAYPTWADGVWKGALAQGRAELEAPAVAALTRTAAGLRRRWVRRTSRS